MFSPATTPPRFPTLVLMTALSVLALNMFLPSLANIARDLETSYALASLAISGFLFVNGVVLFVIGPIADFYGRRPVLLVAMLLFVASSLVCAVAENIWVFLAARTVQAIMIAGSSLASAIISDTHDKSRAASLLAYLAMAMAVAPMLAPMIGGLLDQTLGWRSGFWAYTILGTFAFWLLWVDLGETNPSPAATMLAQIRTYPELFVSRRFWGYTLVMSCGIGAFFLFLAAAPLVGQEIYDLSPAIVGLGIGSITGGFFCGSFLSGRYSQRMGILWMILVGRAVAVIGLSAALCLFALGLNHPLVFFAGAISAGFANGLSIPNARAGALAMRPHIAGSASGLSGALVVFFGAVLTLLPGLFLTPENGAWLTLVMLLVLSLGALAAGFYVRHIDQKEAAVADRATP